MERERETQTERKNKSGREQHVLWRSFNSLVWGLSLQASSGFGLTQGPVLRLDFSTKASGTLTGWTIPLVPLLSLTPEEPFCKCIVLEVSLTSRMRNRWSLSFIQAGCYFYLEVICMQRTDYSCSAKDPSIPCFSKDMTYDAYYDRYSEIPKFSSYLA